MVEKSWPPGIRPTASGTGLEIQLWHKGKRIYFETLSGNPHSKKLLAAAHKRRGELLSRQSLGLPLTDDDAEESTNSLFFDDALDFLRAFDGKASTLYDYTGYLDSFWLPELRNHFTRSITKKRIMKIISGWTVSHKTKKNRLLPLHGIFDMLEIEPNPARVYKKRTRKAQMKPKRKLRYSPKERDALLSRLEGQSLLYFSIFIGCGLRPGENLGLEIPAFNGLQLDVHQQITRRRFEPTTKTYVERLVDVPSWVRVILKEHIGIRKEGPLYLNSIGTAVKDSDRFNAVWKSAHIAEGITYRDPYTCRHNRAAELLSTGVEPAEAAGQLGHSLEEFFRTYAEYIEEFGRKEKRDPNRFEGVSPQFDRNYVKKGNLKLVKSE
jgi:integrase